MENAAISGNAGMTAPAARQAPPPPAPTAPSPPPPPAPSSPPSPAGPPPPAPTRQSTPPASAPTASRPAPSRPAPEKSVPHEPVAIPPDEQYFVKARPVVPSAFESPVSPAPAREDSWVKPIMAVVGILVAAVVGFMAVKALRTESPTVNMGADEQVSEIKVDSLFGRLDGYGYRALPPAVEQQTDQLIQTVPGAQAVLKDIGVRAVTRGSQVVGVISAITVAPEAMEETDFRLGGFEEMEEAFGAKPEKLELGGLEVYSMNMSGGSFGIPSGTIVLCFYENAIVFVFGFDEATTHDITTQLAKVAPKS